MFCGKCGETLDKNVNFCTKCGAPVEIFSVGNSHTTVKKRTKRKIVGLCAICVAIILMALIGLKVAIAYTKKNSPEAAIQAYFDMIASGNLNEITDLIPEEKIDAWEKCFGKSFEEHLAVYVTYRGESFSDYMDAVLGNHDYYSESRADKMIKESYGYALLFYKCGKISVKVEEIDDSSMAIATSNRICDDTSNMTDDEFFQWISELYNNLYDFSYSDILWYEADKVVCCETTLKSSSDEISGSVYAYQLNGKWYCVDALLLV